MANISQSGSPERISLYYRDGGSDKVYHAQIEEQAGQYVVNFQYGRRGSTLQVGTKTAVPVDHAKALKIFEKLIQEKKDGVRLMVRFLGSEVVGSNRKGLVIPISADIEQGVRVLFGADSGVLDGEAIGDVYWVFDLLELNGRDLRQDGAWDRYLELEEQFLPDDSDSIKIVSGHDLPSSKRDVLDKLRAGLAEGVVFKKKSASYIPGRPNAGGDHLKFKFKASATGRVMGQNSGKRSVMISMLQDSAIGIPPLVGVGSVTIPPNYQIPPPGSCVEIEYLYAYPGGALFQPVYRGERSDKDQPDFYSTLKFKQTAEDDDA